MITGSDTLDGILRGSTRWYLSIQSWLGDQLLADDIPVTSGTEENDITLTVPERLTLSVPRYDKGTDWSPTTTDHPLAWFGQRLIVRMGRGVGNAEPEWLQRGEFLIEDSETSGNTISVAAVGLLALIDEARFVSPFQPSGTLVSTLRALIEPALTVVVDSTLVDRSVPTAINFDEDRLGSVLELLDAWPADQYVDPQGFLRVVPLLSVPDTIPIFDENAGGTVIVSTGSGTREGAANAYVVRGTASDGGQVQGVAYLTDGPYAYGGTFSPLPVPDYFESPLITTVDQATAAAEGRRDRAAQGTGETFQVTANPDPRLQGRDFVVLIRKGEDTGRVCQVQQLTLPLRAKDGPMNFRAVSVSSVTP